MRLLLLTYRERVVSLLFEKLIGMQLIGREKFFVGGLSYELDFEAPAIV